MLSILVIHLLRQQFDNDGYAMGRWNKALLALSLQLLGTAFANETQSLQEIDDLVKHFVQHSVREFHGENSDFTVKIGQLDSHLRLEACEEDLTPSIEFGQVSQHNFTVKVACAAPKKWSVRLPVKVQVFKHVVMNKQHINKDMPLTANELDLVRQDISVINDSFYESIDDLNGLVAQKNIASGSVIKHHMVKQPTLVRRGEMVKMVIQAPGITIEGTGVAQSDGIKGQVVKVKNIRSNRIVDAMVVDTGVTTIPM